MNAPVSVYLSAGSNIEPARHLRAAVAALRERYGALRLSPVYRSAPVGFAGQDFLNLVIGFETSERPAEILRFLESLHRRAGRDRRGGRLSSHSLDLDLLLYGDLVCETPPLPRDDILDYAFVLAPLADLAPDLAHPVSGRRIGELWAAFDKAQPPLKRIDLDLG